MPEHFVKPLFCQEILNSSGTGQKVMKAGHIGQNFVKQNWELIQSLTASNSFSMNSRALKLYDIDLLQWECIMYVLIFGLFLFGWTLHLLVYTIQGGRKVRYRLSAFWKQELFGNPFNEFKLWLIPEVTIHTVNNKKTRTPCFSTLRFSRISPEPLKLQKIYLHFFISVFKDNQLILAKMLIFQ